MLFVKGGWVYIITNITHTVLYTGVTSDLRSRMIQHREKHFSGFASSYNCTILVYYAPFHYITDAIAEEKRLKAGSRKRKLDLIRSMNPRWKDLWEDVKTWE